MSPDDRPIWRGFAAFLVCLTCTASGCKPEREKLPFRSTPTITVEDQVPVVPAGQAPKPPLAIAEPEAPARIFQAEDLGALAPKALVLMAAALAREHRWQSAAQCQYWAVQKTGQNQYNLACYLAQSDQKNAAFYWLQLAALEEGVEAAYAEKDSDLASLWRDPRAPLVRVFLRQCEEYWATQGGQSTTLILPKNYDGSTPLWTVVGLHELGSQPDKMISPAFQRFADELNMAFVGVSGTIARGKAKFVWSERPEKDHMQIVKALDSLAGRLKVQPGHMIALGFSEGAQVAMETAARHPEYYAGAIAISPESVRGSQLDKVMASPYMAKRGFVFVVGDQEPQPNKILAGRDRLWAQDAHAQVIWRPTPDQSEHRLPADFGERLPEWLRFIEKANER